MSDDTTELCKRFPTLAPVAFHEAGHAVAAIAFGRAIIATSIEHAKDNPRSSAFMWHKCNHSNPSAMRQEMVILAAGPIAERKLDPKREGGELFDVGDAYLIAWNLVGRLASTSRAEAELRRAKRTARKLVDERWDCIKRVANALLQTHYIMNSVRSLNLSARDAPANCGKESHDLEQKSRRRRRPSNSKQKKAGRRVS